MSGERTAEEVVAQFKVAWCPTISVTSDVHIGRSWEMPSLSFGGSLLDIFRLDLDNMETTQIPHLDIALKPTSLTHNTRCR